MSAPPFPSQGVIGQRRWTTGALATLLLHGGVAAAILFHPDLFKHPATEAAPVAIDLAPPAASSPTPRPDTPPAPEPRLQSHPRAAPTPTPPVPLARQTTPDALSAPQPKSTATQQPDQKSRPASEAAAPPALAAPVRAQDSAPQAGSQNTMANHVRMTWRDEVMAKLERYKRYPPQARFDRQEDVVFVRFTVDRSGRVVGSRLVSSRGFGALDDEALSLLSRVSPLPAPPASVGDADLTLTVPISFSLDEG